MASNHSPRIVTDGLVVYLNAANINSYPGSGNVWYDLTGNGNHFEVTNSTFSSGSLGELSHGSGAVVGRSSIVGVSTSCTAIMWMRTATTTGILFGLYTNAGGTYYGAFNPNVASGNFYQDPNLPNTVKIDSRVVTNPSTAGYLDNKFHMWQIDNMDISTWGGARLFFGTLCTSSIIMIYNRTLSDVESVQNFNTIRSRFSL